MNVTADTSLLDTRVLCIISTVDSPRPLDTSVNAMIIIAISASEFQFNRIRKVAARYVYTPFNGL